MKILVLGDIHGRTIWKDIISKETPDKVIFLGDYVSSHDNINGDDQISNLKNIIEYKKNNYDKVVLLRGNHDIQHLGYYWARCSGENHKVLYFMSTPEFKEEFLSLTSWIYIEKDIETIFSHAGVSKTWLDEILGDTIENINKYEPDERFGFTPNWLGDYYGESPTQPPTWIRPSTLISCKAIGWSQVVGHTPVKNIINLKKTLDIDQDNIWLCDALGVNQYLVINNKKFEPKTL